ncbi:mitochondrial carrier domain-containing protein [Scheffersomyces xylosifermentans]|uniref:mitochondrial carrier domain-containing protein n=1 Tax=Scheffersomyces xylosifermentans TaxID=1304137 RepID=UPI00315C7970
MEQGNATNHDGVVRFQSTTRNLTPSFYRILKGLSPSPIQAESDINFDEEFDTYRSNPEPPHGTGSIPNKNSNKTVSLSAAGIRAIMYQLQTIYLRTPVKLFRPSRFDYLAYVRELANKHDRIDEKPYRFRTHSSIGMLVNVVKKEGWKFIPDQVLPPLIANSATGLILYGTYLVSLDHFNGQHSPKEDKPREFYYYSPFDTWRAGFIAGAAQSLAAAPVDAIYTRSSAAEMLSGSHQNLWVYGLNKLKEIGLVGVFAGYGFSLMKESIGFAFYFSTFETVKTQGYNISYRVISTYRRSREAIKKKLREITKMNEEEIDEKLVRLERTRSTKILKSTFVLLAGASAAFSLLAIQYPITKVHKLHLSRLEALDVYNASTSHSYRPFITLYYNSYIETYNQVLKMKQKTKMTWFQMAYKGFVRNALTTIPATSVGLLVFEIMRTRLSEDMSEFEVLD